MIAVSPPLVTRPSVTLPPLMPVDVLPPLGSTSTLHQAWRDNASRAVMSRLLSLSKVLMSEVQLDRVYSAVLQVVQDATGADRVSLQVLDESGAELLLAAAHGLPASVALGQITPRARGLAGYVLDRLEPLLVIGAAHDDPSVQRLLQHARHDQSALCVPLFAHGEPVGVLNATRFDARQPFGAADLDFLAMLAGPVALAIAHARLHEQTTRLASHDALTGLLNHRAFQEQCAAELERASRGSAEFSLLALDLDRFKQVNDGYGHAAGDRLLRLVAREAIHASVRPYDVVGRIGGDEFAVLLPNTTVEQANLVGERMREAVARLDFARYDLPANAVTLSIGVAHYPSDAVKAEELRAVADKGLYYAKYLGRDQLQRGAANAVGFEHDPEHLQQLLEGSNHAVIEALAAAVDARDAYTAGHSQRVAEYAMALARACGHDDAFCHQVRIAALFHDVGKIGVPDAVLLKPGRLTDEEFAEIQKHPTIGADRVLAKVPFLRDSLPAIRHHHERWDGRGYPAALKGDEIPYMARILALADAYDAMTSTRIYRQALLFDDVVRIFDTGAGTQWDPELTKVWLEYMRAHPPVSAGAPAAEPTGA